MKKFNKTIEIKVSVDAIASNLRSKLIAEFPHADLLVEAIIGTSMDKGTIGHVYNAMNGFDVGIDFAEGDIVYTAQECYVDGKYQPIGVVKVVEVNQYASENVKITYSKPGASTATEMWVKHSTLTVPTPDQLETAGMFGEYEAAVEAKAKAKG